METGRIIRNTSAKLWGLEIGECTVQETLGKSLNTERQKGGCAEPNFPTKRLADGAESVVLADDVESVILEVNCSQAENRDFSFCISHKLVSIDR